MSDMARQFVERNRESVANDQPEARRFPKAPVMPEPVPNTRAVIPQAEEEVRPKASVTSTSGLDGSSKPQKRRVIFESADALTAFVPTPPPEETKPSPQPSPTSQSSKSGLSQTARQKPKPTPSSSRPAKERKPRAKSPHPKSSKPSQTTSSGSTPAPFALSEDALKALAILSAELGRQSVQQ